MLLCPAAVRETETVITVGHGQAKIGNKTFPPTPDLTAERPTRRVLAGGRSVDLALKALINRSFLLRFLSECLPLTEQRAGGELSSGERLERKSVFGIADRKLDIKLNRRKHMDAGSTMVRVCICENYAPESLELYAPQLFRLVCQLWPAITRLASACETLSPGWTVKKPLQELRSFTRNKEWRDGGGAGRHSFRRGAARAILEAGGSVSCLLRSGQWRSSAYELHFDLGREESIAVASILFEALDNEWRARQQGRATGGFKVHGIPESNRTLA